MELQNTTYGHCRCCLAKGNHRNMLKEYFFNGTREVYFDIFMECFNLFLTTDQSLSKLICGACIERLREASAFRSMVVATERQLLDPLYNKDDKEMVFVNVPVEETLQNVTNVKHENFDVIKMEISDYEDGQDMGDDGDDDDEDDPEYLPDDDNGQDENAQEYSLDQIEEMPIEEAELLSRHPPSKLPTRNTLYSICPAYVKHLDLLKGIKMTPLKIAKLLEREIDRPLLSRKQLFVTEKTAHIINASTLLECSNMTPFRSRSRNGFPCFYCRHMFDNLEKLKDHTVLHNKGESKKVLLTYGAECLVVYADISNLTCTLCNKNINNINDLKIHLTKDHKKKMHLEHNDRVIPFKLSPDNVYECQVCGFNFETFGSIERHMNVHFRNYVCRDCGTGFVTKYRLKVHVKSMHVGGSFPCDICKKVFTTQQKHKNHVDTVHKMVKRFKCSKCSERFSEYFKRQKHLVEKHGVAPLQYKCNVCEKSFDRRYTLSRHLKRDHLEERDFQCHLCSYKCFTNNELRVHMIKHNGERIFECSVCKKSYARKKTLKEHMRIHNNDRRFACAVCGQAFVQKCSLKGHLKTHHHEYTIQ